LFQAPAGIIERTLQIAVDEGDVGYVKHLSHPVYLIEYFLEYVECLDHERLGHGIVSSLVERLAKVGQRHTYPPPVACLHSHGHRLLETGHGLIKIAPVHSHRAEHPKSKAASSLIIHSLELVYGGLGSSTGKLQRAKTFGDDGGICQRPRPQPGWGWSRVGQCLLEHRLPVSPVTLVLQESPKWH
jgi:hypothetical protein